MNQQNQTDEPKGLYPKYEIFKNGQRVEGDIFVLRPDRDRHALAAIIAYAESVESENPELAKDLTRWWEYLSGLH